MTLRLGSDHFEKSFTSDDGTDLIKGHIWKFRTVGEDEWMMNLIPRNTDLIGLAEQLLGEGNLLPPSGVRGIYTTLPQEDHEAAENRLHIDQHIFHLSTVSYLDKVVVGGGGFRVWPGSHLWFSNIFESMYKTDPFNRYQEAKSFFETQPSLEWHWRCRRRGLLAPSPRPYGRLQYLSQPAIGGLVTISKY